MVLGNLIDIEVFLVLGALLWAIQLILLLW